MKIAFVSEMFLPFAPGGAEWSTYYLAKELMSKGNQVVVITPNYGGAKQEIMDGVIVKRYPFYIRLQKNNVFLGNFFFTNPLWYLWSTIMNYYYLKRENPDLIHIQGKYSIPSMVIVNTILRKPILATIRDYQVVCNYGMCLTRSDKACSLKQYFLQDFPEYYQNYVKNKNLFNFAINLGFAVWGRVSRNFLMFFSKRLAVVALSSKQKEIFLANGFRKVYAIGNSTEFPDSVKGLKRENIVLFAGRLSRGKGVEMIIKIIPEFLRLFPKYEILFAGEGLLKEKLQTISKADKRVKVLGQVKHGDLLHLYRRARLVIVPSLWPEPFGRIALEALSQGTPAVVTDRGGLPEIVRDNRWGVVIPATAEGLLGGVKKAIVKNLFFQNNIEKDRKIIKYKFGSKITLKYLQLYREIIK